MERYANPTEMYAEDTGVFRGAAAVADINMRTEPQPEPDEGALTRTKTVPLQGEAKAAGSLYNMDERKMVIAAMTLQAWYRSMKERQQVRPCLLPAPSFCPSCAGG